MAECIVRAPKNSKVDYSYIAFSFGGLHSYEDFELYRVSDKQRYNEGLGPQIEDKTIETGDKDTIIGSSNYKPRTFNISFAFDHLTEEKLLELRTWLGGKDLQYLWFAEAPYKVYSAKVARSPILSYIPFGEDYIEDGQKKTRLVYKGEGEVQFICYCPFARTPDKIQRWEKDAWVDVGSGITYSNYEVFANYKAFENCLPGKEGNCGDLPFHFVANLIPPKYKTTSTIRLDNSKSNGLSIEYKDATVVAINGTTEVIFQENT